MRLASDTLYKNLEVNGNTDIRMGIETMGKINQLGTLDEAVQLIVAEHPEWDLGSETVYRFMMAVRRKIR